MIFPLDDLFGDFQALFDYRVKIPFSLTVIPGMHSTTVVKKLLLKCCRDGDFFSIMVLVVPALKIFQATPRSPCTLRRKRQLDPTALTKRLCKIRSNSSVADSYGDTLDTSRRIFVGP